MIPKLTHKDKELNALRWLAMGAIGFYLFRALKKEGKLTNVLDRPEAARFQTQQFLEMGANLIAEQVPAPARPLINPLTQIGSAYLDKLLGQHQEEP